METIEVEATYREQIATALEAARAAGEPPAKRHELYIVLRRCRADTLGIVCDVIVEGYDQWLQQITERLSGQKPPEQT